MAKCGYRCSYIHYSIIALITVGHKAAKAALRNPVKKFADGLVLKINGLDLISQVIDALQLDLDHLPFEHRCFFRGDQSVIQGCLDFPLQEYFGLFYFLSFEISIGLFGDVLPE